MRALITSLAFLGAVALSSSAQVPANLSFQGRLVDSGGDPVTNPMLSMTFRLYKDGSMVWEETHPDVAVVDGVFDVTLGATIPLDTLAFDGPVELGISVGGDPEMSPRTPLAAGAYARALPGLHTVYREASGFKSYNVVGGSEHNFVEEGITGATVAGGGASFGTSIYRNSVKGSFGTVSGGRSNSAEESSSTVGGGWGNSTQNEGATVAGGRGSIASGQYSFIGGGVWHDGSGDWSVIGGGDTNGATGPHSAVLGGQSNTATEPYATVGGGKENEAFGLGSTICGGADNLVLDRYGTVAGGSGNVATDSFATVPGGLGNAAGGASSFAAGNNAAALHDGTFVWSDRSQPSGSEEFESTAENQFLIQAAGGVGIGTNAPSTVLNVFGPGSFVGGVNPFEEVVSRIQGPANTALSVDAPTGFDPLVYFANNGVGVWSLRNDAPSNVFQLRKPGESPTTVLEVKRTEKESWLRPGVDNTLDLGSSDRRWKVVFAANGTINTSDLRLKTDIRPLDYGLSEVMRLEPIRYRWKEDPEAERLGFSAQDASSILPEVVATPESPDGYFGMYYDEIIPVLVRAIQEQQREIEELRSELRLRPKGANRCDLATRSTPF